MRKKSKSAKTAKRTKTKYEWIGRGWKNIAKDGSKMAGDPYVNVVWDDDIESIHGLNNPDIKFHLYKNNKRKGKKDADYRFVMLMPDKNEETDEADEIDEDF